MRYVMTVSTNTLIWATVLTSCYRFGLSSVVSDDSLSKPLEDSSEGDSNLAKRDWRKGIQGWGKRSWSSLHGEWGKRDSSDHPTFDKRAWQNLQGGWGKRTSPEEDYILSNIADSIQDDDSIPEYSYYAENVNDNNKRAWNSMHSTGWGKRSGGRKWGSIKDDWEIGLGRAGEGVWGKREPAWTNLKGIWGKRSGSFQ